MIEFEPVVEDVAYKIELAGSEHILSPAWDTVHIWHGLGYAALKEFGPNGEMMELWMHEASALPFMEEMGLGAVYRATISESENERRLDWLAGFAVDALDFEVTDGSD